MSHHCHQNVMLVRDNFELHCLPEQNAHWDVTWEQADNTMQLRSVNDCTSEKFQWTVQALMTLPTLLDALQLLYHCVSCTAKTFPVKVHRRAWPGAALSTDTIGLPTTSSPRLPGTVWYWYTYMGIREGVRGRKRHSSDGSSINTNDAP